MRFMRFITLTLAMLALTFPVMAKDKGMKEKWCCMKDGATLELKKGKMSTKKMCVKSNEAPSASTGSKRSRKMAKKCAKKGGEWEKETTNVDSELSLP